MKSAAAIHRPHPSRNTTLAADFNSGSRAEEISPCVASQAVFFDITQTFGVSFAPDLFVGMRDRPAYLEATWELFKGDLGLDSLNYSTKRIIALAITTNEAGTYYIAAYPPTFRLDALDLAEGIPEYTGWLLTRADAAEVVQRLDSASLRSINVSSRW